MKKQTQNEDMSLTARIKAINSGQLCSLLGQWADILQDKQLQSPRTKNPRIANHNTQSEFFQ